MKKFIKWFSIGLAGLLALAVAFTAFFVVIPLSRSVKNLREKQNEPAAFPQQTVTQAAQEPVTGETAPAGTPAPEAEATTAAPQAEPAFTEYDIYRSGRFYIKGSVTGENGETNPMELAVTDGSIYMLTTASGVQMGVMIGGGKTYLVSPEHKMYIEMSGMVMSVLGMDSKKLAAPDNFNFSEMRPLSEADTVTQTELNGEECTEYVFGTAGGKRTCVYLNGTRLLQTDMYDEADTLHNRMTFETVSAEVPSDRIAPPTYYQKAGLLKFMSTVASDVSQ